MSSPGMRHFDKSAKSDPVDTTLIGATKWNKRHYFLEDDGTTMAGTLGDLPYNGTGGLVTLLTGAQGVLTSAGSGNVPAWSMAPSLTSLTASSFVSVGSTPATTGDVRVPNATTVLAARNGADNGNIPLITTDVSNYLIIGGDTSLNRPAGIVVKSTGSSGAQIQLGGTPGSASNPMITNSGPMLRVRLGSGGAYTDIAAANVLADDAASHGFILNGVIWKSGSGTPEGAVTAPVGSIYSRTNGGAATSFYVKESGSGNTGWVAK